MLHPKTLVVYCLGSYPMLVRPVSLARFIILTAQLSFPLLDSLTPHNENSLVRREDQRARRRKHLLPPLRLSKGAREGKGPH